ncbi:hypothetical protein LTR84_008681 [Exophiala bonariae]|uniref:RRN7-type domain-containing protein n=1 Tax=Exophiala bonariae TaxID=1690606 RepID=A0AAV9MW07_9EURO|nr:hypothetical protein LTR84_008681 [Exophiala bonariae]
MAEDDGCEICGSTDFAVDDDGRTYCANGHDQGRGPVTAEDDQDFVRKGKVVRKKEKKVKQKISKILRGAKAYQLYLQAWQYILWKQSYTLVHQLGLPADLWTVVRDLWSLWLTKLESRLQNDAPTSGPDASESEGQVKDKKSGGDETDTDGDGDGDRDTDAEAADRGSGHRSDGTNDAVKKGPGLIDTVVLNYLAMILLRCPIELATLLSWIQAETIVYIRAIRFIPQGMKDKLPSEYHAALDTPTRLPGPDDLQLAVYRRAQMFDLFFGMVTPPLNHFPFFISYTRSLALPIEVYSLALRLNRITKYEFAHLEQPATAAGKAKSISRRIPHRRHATSYPEAQIMSLIVVATKLLHPFDSATVTRHPESPNDLATLRMDWEVWLAAKTEMETEMENSLDSMKPGREMSLTDADALSMTDTQLDQYLDWYQRMWLNPSAGEQHSHSQSQSHSHGQNQPQSQTQTQNQEPNTIDQTILNLFPLPLLATAEKTRAEHVAAAQQRETLLAKRIERVQASLSPVRAIAPAEEAKHHTPILRPGAGYPRYRRVQDLNHRGGIEKSATGVDAVRVFHDEAAHTACLSLAALLRAVARTEDLIEAWKRERRREEYFAAEAAEEEEQEEGGNGDEYANKQEKGKAKAKAEAENPGPPHPSSSAALVRGLGDLDIADFGSPASVPAAGYGPRDGEEVGGGDLNGSDDDEGMADEDGYDEPGENRDGHNYGGMDVDMEMAMEYLPQL